MHKPLRGRKVRIGLPLHNWIRRVLSSVHMSILRRQADARRTYPLFLSRRAHRGINLGENRWSTVAVGRGLTNRRLVPLSSLLTSQSGSRRRHPGTLLSLPSIPFLFPRRSQLGHRDRLYDGAVSRDRDEVVVLGDPARLRRRPRRRRRWRRRRRRQRSPRAAHRAEVELGGRGRQGRVTLRLPSVMLSGPPRVSVDRWRLDVLVVVQVLRVPRRTEASPRYGKECSGHRFFGDQIFSVLIYPQGAEMSKRKRMRRPLPCCNPNGRRSRSAPRGKSCRGHPV